MKKLYALLVFALITFAMASCTEEEVKPSSNTVGGGTQSGGGF